MLRHFQLHALFFIHTIFKSINCSRCQSLKWLLDKEPNQYNPLYLKGNVLCCVSFWQSWKYNGTVHYEAIKRKAFCLLKKSKIATKEPLAPFWGVSLQKHLKRVLIELACFVPALTLSALGWVKTAIFRVLTFAAVGVADFCEWVIAILCFLFWVAWSLCI